MEARTLTTEPRSATGKGPARQLRLHGRVPAVLYGAGVEPTSLSVVPKELAAVLATAHRRNQLVDLGIAGAQHLAMIKELQVHPVTRAFLHVDFFKVDPAREIEVPVPLAAVGRAKGVLAGGELRAQFRVLPVRAKPADIPAELAIDVSELDLNQSLRVKDLPLPAGVSVAMAPERTVFACSIPRRAVEDEAAAATPGAAGEAAAGAPAAEAAGGDAAAAGGKPAAGKKES